MRPSHADALAGTAARCRPEAVRIERALGAACAACRSPPTTGAASRRAEHARDLGQHRARKSGTACDMCRHTIRSKLRIGVLQRERVALLIARCAPERAAVAARQREVAFEDVDAQHVRLRIAFRQPARDLAGAAAQVEDARRPGQAVAIEQPLFLRPDRFGLVREVARHRLVAHLLRPAGCGPGSCPVFVHGRRDSVRAHEILLADLDAVVAQQRISGRDVEEELRQAIGKQVGLAIEACVPSACPGRSTICRSPAPSNCAASSPSMKASVLRDAGMQFRKRLFVVVVRRHVDAGQPRGHVLAKSQAICTWRVNGNMSGNSRACSSAAGSIFFSAAWASALDRTPSRPPSICRKTGIEAIYMALVIVKSAVGEDIAYSPGATRGFAAEDREPCGSGSLTAAEWGRKHSDVVKWISRVVRSEQGLLVRRQHRGSP